MSPERTQPSTVSVPARGNRAGRTGGVAREVEQQPELVVVRTSAGSRQRTQVASRRHAEGVALALRVHRTPFGPLGARNGFAVLRSPRPSLASRSQLAGDNGNDE